MSVSEDSDLTNNKYEDEELIWKNVTVLLADPHLDEYWSWWIPQDDLDMEEFKQNIEAIKGIGKVTYYDDHRRLLKDWIDNPPEFVFNQCDEGYMNKEEFESHLTSVMDILNIPYTGPGPEGLCAVKDKSIVRGAAMSVGVPVPTEVYIEEGASFRSALPDTMVYPAFCKLANASGSMGVLQKCLAYNKEEAIAGLEELRRQHPHRPLLLQEYLSGREFSIAVVGNPELGDFEVFPPVEVDYSGLDTSKYAPIQLEEFKRDGNSEFWQQVKEIRADLTPEQLSALKSAAERMFIRTKCTDFARMDFRMDKNGVIKIMDVNPNCWLGGKYRMMAEWAGYTWPQVLRRIFLTAQKRHQLREKKRKERDEYEKSLSAKTKSQYEVPQV